MYWAGAIGIAIVLVLVATGTIGSALIALWLPLALIVGMTIWAFR